MLLVVCSVIVAATTAAKIEGRNREPRLLVVSEYIVYGNMLSRSPSVRRRLKSLAQTDAKLHYAYLHTPNPQLEMSKFADDRVGDDNGDDGPLLLHHGEEAAEEDRPVQQREEEEGHRGQRHQGIHQ